MNKHAIKDINEVLPRTASDDPLFAELAAVLKKHDALDRFGITLLHTHFPVADDEIMFEENDPEDRTLSMKTVKKADLEGVDYSETSWHLGPNGEVMMGCVCKKFGSEHSHSHKRVSSSAA
jgi:hypothetical protein